MYSKIYSPLSKKSYDIKRKDGLAIIPSIYSTQQCKQFVMSCEDLKNKLCKKEFNIVSEETIFIINYFRHNKNLLKLIWNPLLDRILRELIDQDYVLAASNLINKTLSNNKVFILFQNKNLFCNFYNLNKNNYFKLSFILYHFLHKTLINFFLKDSDYIIVQTNSMKKLIKSYKSSF